MDIDNLTDLVFDKIRDDLLPLYYTTEKSIQRGQVLHAVKKTFTPEFIVFNPLDYDKIDKGSAGRRLVHLREYTKVVTGRG